MYVTLPGLTLPLQPGQRGLESRSETSLARTTDATPTTTEAGGASRVVQAVGIFVKVFIIDVCSKHTVLPPAEVFFGLHAPLLDRSQDLCL